MDKKKDLNRFDMTDRCSQQEPGGGGSGSSSRNAQQAAKHEWCRQGGALGGHWPSLQCSHSCSSPSPIRSESTKYNEKGHHKPIDRLLDLFPISRNEDSLRPPQQQIAAQTEFLASQNCKPRLAPPPGFESRDFGQHMPVFPFRTLEPSDAGNRRNIGSISNGIHTTYGGRSNEARLREALNLYQLATRVIGKDFLERCDPEKLTIEDIILPKNMLPKSQIGTAHAVRQKLENFIVETSLSTDNAYV